MTFRTTALSRAMRQPMAKKRVHIAMLAAMLWGVLLFPTDTIAGVPEASGPVCVPVPGMPCPGSAQSASSGTSRSTYSSGSRSAKPSTNAIMLKELQNSINQMTTPNPATLQRIKQTQMDGNQAHQEAVTAQQTTEEQRRQKALRDAEAARMKQIQDLANALQGLPENTPAGVDLRPGGTSFFGLGGSQGGAPLPGPDLDALRAAGSSGFDTRGPLRVDHLPLPPPPASPPMPVEFKEKQIPPESVTPEIQALLNEREEIRSRKKETQASLERFESKGKLTPEESATMAKLKQDLAVTLNKEDFLTFSINESLP